MAGYMRAVRIISYKNMKNKCRKDDSFAENIQYSLHVQKILNFTLITRKNGDLDLPQQINRSRRHVQKCIVTRQRLRGKSSSWSKALPPVAGDQRTNKNSQDHLWGFWQLSGDFCKTESIELLGWRSFGCFLCFWPSCVLDRSHLEPLCWWLPCPCDLLAITCSDKSMVCACVGRWWCFSFGEGFGVVSFECLLWWNKSVTL